MNLETTWEIIEKSTQAQDRVLKKLLKKQNKDAIVAFARNAGELMAATDTPALRCAKWLHYGDYDKYLFHQFRAWLVVSGRENYERVLKDPDTLAAAFAAGNIAREVGDFEDEIWELLSPKERNIPHLFNDDSDRSITLTVVDKDGLRDQFPKLWIGHNWGWDRPNSHEAPPDGLALLAARLNLELSLLSRALSELAEPACREVLSGGTVDVPGLCTICIEPWPGGKPPKEVLIDAATGRKVRRPENFLRARPAELLKFVFEDSLDEKLNQINWVRLLHNDTSVRPALRSDDFENASGMTIVGNLPCG